MKKLKIKFWNDLFFDFICFEADWSQIQYIFIENRNFEIKPVVLPFQRHYLELDDKYLNLKQFKIEVL
jgi:hypothetical protein